jgi:hypothetical protein
MVVRQADFTGVATKAGLECSDGRTIMPHAFAEQDGQKVPLLWAHGHNDPSNVLGHAILRKNAEGDMECDAYFNPNNPKAASTKVLVEHGDVNSLSIYANRLIEKGKKVFGGKIKEVSVVLAGANPGALIKNVNFAHGDEETMLEDEVFIFTGLRLMHADGTPFPDPEDAEEEPSQEELDNSKEEQDSEENDEDEAEDGEAAHADTDTLNEVWDSMSDEQKKLARHMVSVALEHEDTDTDSNTEDNGLNDTEGTEMGHNAFEQNGASGSGEGDTLVHVDFDEIKENWKRGGSMKHAVEEYCLKHGIENLDSLFPDPQKLQDEPQFDMRRQEGVQTVLNGVRHTPFAKVKTLWSDITHEEARALGYIKGNLKKEEFFGIKKRTTSSTWIYKKQKLDREDIINATELRVVAWMKAEMQLMLKEEIARAILIGDGRPVEDPANPGEPNPDKIKDPAGAVDGEGIRSILNDDPLFVATVNVEVPANVGDSWQGVVEEIMVGMELYKGSGSPTFFTTLGKLNRMLLSKDGFQRRHWKTKEELASEMGVANIVTLDFMADSYAEDCLGIIVNLQDYNVGTDAGGEVTLFDDFDLDYNQYKYLIETLFSGALVKIRSAIRVMIQPTASTELADPEVPSFNETTGVVTIPASTNFVYKDASDDSTLTAGAQPALADGETLEVYASPNSGYYFANSEVDGPWEFTK